MSEPTAPAAPLPTTEQRLHPWSWLFVLLQQLRQFIVPLLALLVFGRGDRNALWPLVGVAVLALASIWQYFTYRYRVTGDSLVIRSGLFERSLRQIPFARIHNVALHQSLLHRVFGVAEVRLETAGGQKPEAQMRVLGLGDALALERLFRHRGHVADTAGEVEPDAPLLLLPTAEVIRLGLASNRGMIVMAAAFGAAWQVFPDRMAEDFFKDFSRQLFGYASHLQLGWIATATAAMALLGLALLLLRVLSVLLALVQYHAFRLSEDGRRLTVERGLLTKLRTSVARRRIQAWTLHEGVVHRLLKRRSLHIDTAVAERQGEGDQRGLKELAPIATPDACDALVRHLLPDAQWPRAQWKALPASAWWRLFLPTAAFVAIATSVVCAYFGNGWGLLLLSWLPWSAYAARQHAARAGYSVDGELFAVRGGWWSRHWRFAEIDKLQALALRQSPLDRRFGMATLLLDTAGAGAMTPPLQVRYLPESDAQALHARLAAEVARRPLRW
jgi:putative membrane protein